MNLSNKKEQRQKEVRRLLKRRKEIYALQRALGDIELEEPYRHGWYKELVITHRVELYKNSQFILEVYDKIRSCFWGRTKEKAEFQWQNQVSKYLIYKDVSTLSQREFNRLSEGAQRLCIPFQFYDDKRKSRIRFYIKIPKGAYKIKFTRAYVTHKKRIDPELISELSHIEKLLSRKGYYNINEAFYPWKDYWIMSDYKKEKLTEKRRLNAFKKQSVAELIDDQFL